MNIYLFKNYMLILKTYIYIYIHIYITHVFVLNLLIHTKIPLFSSIRDKKNIKIAHIIKRPLINFIIKNVF